MTDKTIETAEFSSSEKQVRFSMKTIRTPPASPGPATSSRFNKTKMEARAASSKPASNSSSVVKPHSNYPVVRKPPVTNQLMDKQIHPVEKIKVNFLEKLEILPESKA